jgi:flagellar motor switch protein FliG
MAILPSMMNPYGLSGPMTPPGMSPAAFSGSLQVENPNKTVMPFGFIREDHMGNLAILLSRETPEKAAVVLGYLPADWISRILARLDPAMQSEVASHLATTRQLLPEQVEDIEQDLKRRLDYLVGGPERIIAIYESLDPEAQKRMLESLKEARPDLVDELRRRTVTFEDLEKLEPAALKAIFREVDLQTIVFSLKGASESLKTRILEHVTEGKAEIIRDELEVSEGTSGRATSEAQRKITLIARRLEREGQIQIPQIQETAPAARYGSLRSILKLPPGLKLDQPAQTPPDATVEDIKEKIRRFMKRGAEEKERFPSGEGTPPSVGPET